MLQREAIPLTYDYVPIEEMEASLLCRNGLTQAIGVDEESRIRSTSEVLPRYSLSSSSSKLSAPRPRLRRIEEAWPIPRALDLTYLLILDVLRFKYEAEERTDVACFCLPHPSLISHRFVRKVCVVIGERNTEERRG